jgi:uncharacterized membrane protein (DUF2068 family)
LAESRRSTGILRLIAIFKLAKSTLLALTAVGVLNLLDPQRAVSVRDWLTGIAASVNPRALEWLLFRFDTLSTRRLEIISLVTGAYAVLFAVEGIGLWLRKRWAEYLTIIATGSFIPFEVYEIARKFSVLRVTTLVLNVLVVAYLIYRVRPSRRPRFARDGSG